MDRNFQALTSLRICQLCLMDSCSLRHQALCSRKWRICQYLISKKEQLVNVEIQSSLRLNKQFSDKTSGPKPIKQRLINGISNFVYNIKRPGIKNLASQHIIQILQTLKSSVKQLLLSLQHKTTQITNASNPFQTYLDRWLKITIL